MGAGIVSTFVIHLVRRIEENRVWQLADECAVSGQFDGWRHIEFELYDRGFHLAPFFLDDESVRARLDRTCANARNSRSSVWTEISRLSSDLKQHASERLGIDLILQWAHDQVRFGSTAFR
jgi:hypothetical protein